MAGHQQWTGDAPCWVETAQGFCTTQCHCSSTLKAKKWDLRGAEALPLAQGDEFHPRWTYLGFFYHDRKWQCTCHPVHWIRWGGGRRHPMFTTSVICAYALWYKRAEVRFTSKASSRVWVLDLASNLLFMYIFLDVTMYSCTTLPIWSLRGEERQVRERPALGWIIKTDLSKLKARGVFTPASLRQLHSSTKAWEK